MDFWERASSRMVKATIFSLILLRNYNLFVATAVVIYYNDFLMNLLRGGGVQRGKAFNFEFILLNFH